MIQALAMLLAVVLLIRRAPKLPLSRLLHAWLAERPARWLARRTRQELLAWAILAALLAFAGEYVLVLGGPQIALSIAVDLAAYIDAVVAVATLASVARVQAAAKWASRGLRRRARPRRRPRTRGARPRPPAANDSDDRPAGLAA